MEMNYYEKNPYYYPQNHGLEIVSEIDDPQACYSFDMFVLWQHEDGRLFYATDSGCSCPSPFEEYGSVEDLDELTADTWTQFEEAVLAWLPYNEDQSTGMLRHEMLRAADKALRGE